MPEVDAGRGIRLFYEEFGEASAPPLLLVMGLGAQLLSWDERFCAELAGRGFRVIRFDNRDVGLSTWLDELGMPDLPGIASGTARAPYSLHDLADDACGLLDALGIEGAHVVGASMGGMIVQLMAIHRPERVLSLCSIMSFCDGAFGSVPATPAAQATLLTSPPVERDAYVTYSVGVSRVNWGPSFDEERARRRATRAFDRAFHPAGTARQLAAIWATRSWREDLASVQCPALVIHGVDDPLVPVENGRRTHAALPAGAELLLVDGMGHDLPPHEWSRLADAIAANAARAKVSQRTSSSRVGVAKRQTRQI